VKARVWKDRARGRWCFDVIGPGIRATGDKATWPAALDAALDELRWIAAHQHGWPANLLALSWRPCPP
jgi:hypothetical protein